MRYRNKVPASITIILLAAAASTAMADPQSDIDTLEKRLVERYLSVVDVTEAGKNLASQQPDGSWADIDYTDRNGRGGWAVIAHMDRLYGMSAAFQGCQNSALKGDPKLLAGIVKRLNHWSRQRRERIGGGTTSASNCGWGRSAC